MTYEHIIAAHAGLSQLRRLRLPYPKAKAFYDAAVKVDAEFEFYSFEEQKLVEQYAQLDEDGTPRLTERGYVVLKSPADKKEYEKKLLELRGLDVPLKLTEIRLTQEDLGQQTISVETMSDLRGIVVFE